jgi:hypothetical protein
MPGGTVDADALRRGHVERARHRAHPDRRRYLAVAPTTGSSPPAGKPTGMTPYGPCKPRARTTNAPARRSSLLTDDLKDRSIRSLATDFATLWSNPDTPQRDRKRTVRLVDDVTLHKTDRIHLHVRLRGGQAASLSVAILPKAWQVRQTHPDNLAALDRLLDTHTSALPQRTKTAVATSPAGGLRSCGASEVLLRGFRVTVDRDGLP